MTEELGTTYDAALSNPEQSEIEKKLISLIQADFPIVSRPFEAIGEELGIDEQEAFNLTEDLIEAGVIRRIGAIFDSYRVGYRSTLCAIAVDPEDLDDIAELINSYPNVTHNYERADHYNMWFTLIAPSDRRVADILADIERRSGYDDILNLPATHLFKIRVDFDLTGTREKKPAPPVITPAEIVPGTFSKIDRTVIRQLQGDISGELRPFEIIGECVSDGEGGHLSEDAVLERARRWKDEGIIRRFGAAVKHHKLGFSHNAMGVWDIADEQVMKAGEIMASMAEVSHCYERPRKATWAANMYTMIHGHSEAECEDVAARIHAALAEAGIDVVAPRLLYSVRELKKVSMRYFSDVSE